MQELRMLVAAAQENILRRIQREASASSFLMDWASSFDASMGMLEKGGYDGLMIFLPLPGDGIKLAFHAAKMPLRKASLKVSVRFSCSASSTLYRL